jgi:hypothetical protein
MGDKTMNQNIAKIILSFLLLIVMSSFIYAEINLTLPLDSSYVSNIPSFYWSSNNTNHSFNLIISSDIAFSTIILNKTVSNNNYTLNLSESLLEGLYYWRVYSVNDSESSLIRNFIVDMNPAQINLISPSQNTLISGISYIVSFNTTMPSVCRFNSIKSGSNTNEDFISKNQTIIDSNGLNHNATIYLLGDDGLKQFYFLCNTTHNSLITEEFEFNITKDINSPSINHISWTSINVNSLSDITVIMNVTDYSNLTNTPKIRYKKWTNPYSEWSNFTSCSGIIQTGLSCNFVIPKAPDNWSQHPNNNITFEINITDILGQSTLMQYYEIINPSQNRPNVTIPITVTGTKDQEISFNISVFDLDNDTIIFSNNLTTNHSLTINKIDNTLARVSWTPRKEDVGLHYIRFSVYDGIFTENFNVQILVNDMNDPPILNHNKEISFTTYVYKVFNFTFNATDLDLNDTLRFSTNSSVFQISPLTGEMRAFPNENSKGIHNLNVTVKDNAGAYDSLLMTINVLYCGDNICSADYEDCSICPKDCGSCNSESSVAIIIPERNCINNTMLIRTMDLVPRATCPIKGTIIGNLETCNNLTNQELFIEKIVNKTYEEVITLITDEAGYTSFIPEEYGNYRITLKSKNVVNYFSINHCFDEGQISFSNNENKNNNNFKDPFISSSIERPQEITLFEEKKPFVILLIMYLIFPLLLLSMSYVGARFYYDYEYKRIISKKIQTSKYVSLIDKNITVPYNNFKKKFKEYIISNDSLCVLYDYYIVLKRKYESKKQLLLSKIILLINKIISYEKPYTNYIPFFKVKIKNDNQLIEALAISSIKYLRKRLEIKEIMTQVKKSSKKYDCNLFGLAFIFKDLKFSAEFSSNKDYTKTEEDINLVKTMLENKVKFKKGEYLLKDLKKKTSSKSVAFAEIGFKDPNTNENIMTIVQICGFDKNNIIINDYYSQEERRKVDLNIFEKAWKNSSYKALIVSK